LKAILHKKEKKNIGTYFNFNATNGLPKQLLNEFINRIVIFSFTKKFKLFPDEENRKRLPLTCLTGRGGIGIRGKFFTSLSRIQIKSLKRRDASMLLN
jgi:hypothetical protein